MLDSDGDGYPDRALKTCSTGDQQTYCSEDTCPFAPNHDQSDTSPCEEDETGIILLCLSGLRFGIMYLCDNRLSGGGG